MGLLAHWNVPFQFSEYLIFFHFLFVLFVLKVKHLKNCIVKMIPLVVKKYLMKFTME